MDTSPLVSTTSDLERPEPFTKTTELVVDGLLHPEDQPASDVTIHAIDETLVVDSRSELSPAQLVEHRLTRMLRDASMPVSHMQVRSLLRAR